jgi:glutathione S-transferase
MILIGQYDSPFVRRVAVALQHYGMRYEHRPWSVWSDAESIARFNPLRRVPTLILEDEQVLVESFAILETLDEIAPPERLLLPRSGPVRRDGLRICALATGAADKAVSLFYEPLLRKDPSVRWIERCRLQIGDALDSLEEDRAERSSRYWLGDSLTHADVAVACMLRFTDEAHPGLFDAGRWPALASHRELCEPLPQFSAVVQPLTVSA